MADQIYSSLQLECIMYYWSLNAPIKSYVLATLCTYLMRCGAHGLPWAVYHPNKWHCEDRFASCHFHHCTHNHSQCVFQSFGFRHVTCGCWQDLVTKRKKETFPCNAMCQYICPTYYDPHINEYSSCEVAFRVKWPQRWVQCLWNALWGCYPFILQWLN